MKFLYAMLILAICSTKVLASDTITFVPVVAYEDRITAERWNEMQRDNCMLKDKITLLEMKILQLQIVVDELRKRINCGWNTTPIPCSER